MCGCGCGNGQKQGVEPKTMSFCSSGWCFCAVRACACDVMRRASERRGNIHLVALLMPEETNVAGASLLPFLGWLVETEQLRPPATTHVTKLGIRQPSKMRKMGWSEALFCSADINLGMDAVSEHVHFKDDVLILLARLDHNFRWKLHTPYVRHVRFSLGKQRGENARATKVFSFCPRIPLRGHRNAPTKATLGL